MANRRMFSADVVCTDRFVEMPSSTQALYFQLGMKADDDGFISSPKQITRMVGAAEDDLKLLASSPAFNVLRIRNCPSRPSIT